MAGKMNVGNVVRIVFGDASYCSDCYQPGHGWFFATDQGMPIALCCSGCGAMLVDDVFKYNNYKGIRKL